MYKWILFVALSLIWGSSFLLMAVGEEQFTAWQVASTRLFFGGLVLAPLVPAALKRIPRRQLLLVIFSGFLASFLPAFLYCIAETRIESSFAGMLNALTPVFVIVNGLLFFRTRPTGAQIAGIGISFLGCLALFVSKNTSTGDLPFALLIILATFCYGYNINMVARKLSNISPVDLIATAFAALAIPALFIMIFTGVFSADYTSPKVQLSAGASVFLGLAGTAFASILFYILMQKAGRIFSSTVTYGIPFVAIFFGWLVYHDSLNIWGWLSLMAILAGIFIANLRKKEKSIVNSEK